MSDLVVITFPNETDGPAALSAMRDAQRGSGLALRDVASVVKDAEGKVHTHNEVSSTTATGAVGGGILGLLLGFVFFPIAGLAIGALAGALIGKSLGHNVDAGLVRDVTNDLTPGTSAVFVLVDGDPAALVGSVRHLEGKVYQTTLDSQLEAQLEEALRSQG
ncbi:MAG: DUF1269 domain-containing protein [Chloroflexi bacterium]|nr:DUF1269 domain-containing protein [Chloroflexota bacterium]